MPWLLGVKENDDGGAADHQVGGSFSGVIAFAHLDAAIDDGPAVIAGGAETKLGERGPSLDLGELQADLNGVKLETLGRPGTVFVVLDNPKLWRIGGARIADLLAHPSAGGTEAVAAEDGGAFVVPGSQVAQYLADADRREWGIGGACEAAGGQNARRGAE